MRVRGREMQRACVEHSATGRTEDSDAAADAGALLHSTHTLITTLEVAQREARSLLTHQ